MVSWNADRGSRWSIEVAVDVFKTRDELICPKRITVVNEIQKFRVLHSLSDRRPPNEVSNL